VVWGLAWASGVVLFFAYAYTGLRDKRWHKRICQVMPTSKPCYFHPYAYLGIMN
jgi:hypothetical protein